VSRATIDSANRRELLFLAPGDVSKGRVEPISWMRSCEAYATAGLEVTLATLRTRRPDAVPKDEIWRHYGIDPCFRVLTLPTRLAYDSSVAAFRLWAGAAGTALAARTATRAVARSTATIIHGRAPVLLAPFAAIRYALPRRRRPLLVFEAHALPKRSHAWLVESADLVVVNSEKLARDVVSVFRVPAGRVLHAPLPPFNPARPEPKLTARRAIGLGPDLAIACYTGKLTKEHSEFLLTAAAEAARRVNGFRLVLVGGNAAILDWTRRRTDEMDLGNSVILTGFVAPAEVSRYQSAADVLVYHMPESVGIFPYTTPAKAYEYQAMRRPIVATDFPLFEEVFGADGDRALCVKHRTPHEFAAGIASAMALPDGGRAMTERAASFVRGRTWVGRSAAILGALEL